MTQAIVEHTSEKALSIGEWQQMKEQAAMLVKTGFLPPSIKTAEQALAIALTGRELGIGMMEAIRGINIIQGKPQVSPQLMLALAIRTGQVEGYSLDSTPDGAIAKIKRKGWPEHTAKFGPLEAKALGLAERDNYKKQPEVMYKWRALSQGLRFVFPDAVSGIYTPEEMGTEVEIETDGSITVKEKEASVQIPKEKKSELSKVPVGVYKDSLISPEEQRQLFKEAFMACGNDYQDQLLNYLKSAFNKEKTHELNYTEYNEAIGHFKKVAESQNLISHATEG